MRATTSTASARAGTSQCRRHRPKLAHDGAWRTDHCYEGRYSTHVYTEHVQGLLRAWTVGSVPLFVYAAYQAVHEPMAAPEEYVAKFAHIGDPSRRLYAAMLLALDEGIGNITATLAAQHMSNDSVVVLSNDNGGMSGTYGIGCLLRHPAAASTTRMAGRIPL